MVPGEERPTAPAPARVGVAVHRARAWWRRPAGRLAGAGLAMAGLVAAAIATGALVVPKTLASGPERAAAAEPTGPVPLDPSVGAVPPSDGPTPTPTPSVGTSPPRVNQGRPADALAGWARRLATKVSIPVTALQAYGYAELVIARTTPSCRLSWPTLAAIGKIESAHGSANSSTLAPSGRVEPAIIGLPLDGQGGRQAIPDTDRGALDGDRTYDRAVGPMQFIPTTWERYAADADGDGVRDPQDIDDAALAAANYLCADDRDLASADDWWRAILSYNDVRPYAQSVFDSANAYGRASRT